MLIIEQRRVQRHLGAFEMFTIAVNIWFFGINNCYRRANMHASNLFGTQRLVDGNWGLLR